MSALIKIFIIVGLIALIMIIYFSCSDVAGCGCRTIDKTLPGVETAPYSVTTKTHLYYAKDAEYGPGGTVMMIYWYERDGGEWVLREESIVIPAVLCPVIERR